MTKTRNAINNDKPKKKKRQALHSYKKLMAINGEITIYLRLTKPHIIALNYHKLKSLIKN